MEAGFPAMAGPSPTVRAWDDPGPADLLAIPAGADEAILSAAVTRGSAALLLTDCHSAEDIGRLAARLAVAEATLGLDDGVTSIVALLDHPAGVLQAASIASASRRLLAIGLDPAALAAALGTPPDSPTPALDTARGLVLLAAAAAGLPAVIRLRGADVLRTEVARAAGFAVVVGPPPGAVA